MRVNRLQLKNFRIHKDSLLDFGTSKFCVLRGRNFSGKTSLAEGLSLAVTPTTWGLSMKGDGYARKIKRGENKAIIEADLQGVNRIIRRTTTLGFISRTQTSEDINDPDWNSRLFDKLLDDKKAALGVAINTRSFMSLVYSRDEDAQKNLLAQLVLTARYEFDKDIVAEVESILGEGTINFSGEPFAVINVSYKKLFSERQDANKKLKEFRIPDALPRPQGVNSESLKTQLSVLREDRQKQSVERDAAGKQANEVALKRERANAKIETLEAVLKASKESLRSIQANILPDPGGFLLVAGKREKLDQLRGEVQRLSHDQETAKAEEVRLHELSQIGSTCPTCDQEIDAPKLAQLMAEIIAKRGNLTEKYNETVRSLNALGDVDGAIAKLEAHKKSLAEKDEVEAKIEAHTLALKQAKDEADQDAGGLFDSATLDSAISSTDKQIETILQQIQPVIAAEEREKEIVTKKEQLKRLEDKAAKLDRLVKYFDKDGIKAKLIATYIGGFEQKVNEVLSAWDYSCSLSIEPFRFEVTDYRKVSTPLIELSGAEEIMFYAAFQCAVSATAGIGFVVIDRVDTLLPELRPMLFKKLYGMLTDKVLDQVILLVADTSEVVPKLADSRFFMIEEGNIRRLG